jgi:sulfoxide reductase heme-binding subunit YedZ
MIYLRRNFDLADVLWHMEDPKIATGWIALLVLLLLAITSNDKSVNTLGSRWKKLHRWVYFSTVLIFLHWALFGFFLNDMLMWLVPITILQAWRLGLRRR